MKRRLCIATAVSMLSLMMVMPTPAQDQPTVFTRVAHWTVARAHWDIYKKDFERIEQPIFEKLLNDGVITEWGTDTVSIHTPEGPTHSTWFSANKLSDLEKALQFLEAAESKMSPEERRRMDVDYGNMKHFDSVVRSEHYRTKAAKQDGGYDYTNLIKVKPGKGQEYQKLWDKYFKPILDGLFESGAITSYGIGEEEFHTDDPGIRVTWWVGPNAATLDKFDAAFQATMKKLTPEERESIQKAFAEITEPGSHRDGLYHILHYAAK